MTYCNFDDFIGLSDIILIKCMLKVFLILALTIDIPRIMSENG